MTEEISESSSSLSVVDVVDDVISVSVGDVVVADVDKKTNKPKKDLRSYLKRGNTVASCTPYQEFSTEKLDDDRKKQNAANAANMDDANGGSKKARPRVIDENLKVRQIQSVPAPVRTPLTLTDIFDSDEGDHKIDCDTLRHHLIHEGKLEKSAAITLIEKAAALFKTETNVIELEAPYTVCGDIHGQFYDLVNLIDNAGDPSTTPYLFLGDYVDRGCFSCEVCFLLFSYKINNPETFHMIRGNHESRAMTNIHNFRVEVLKKYDMDVYNKFMECFDCLPLAAILRCRMLGRFFCVHGGLSPNIDTIDDIQALDRFAEVPSDGAMCDLLWSDPVLDDEEMSARDILEFREIDFLDNSERGIGYFFGFKAISQFLLKNNLVSIVRAHEVQQDGCTEHRFTRVDGSIPMAFTVFSAPNYCDFYSNKAAYIKFLPNKYEIYQLEWVPHPYWLPDFQNVFAFSIDYVLEAVRTMLKSLAKTDDKEESNDEWLQESQSEYVKKLTSMQSKISGRNISSDPEYAGLSPKEKFKKARESDIKFEKAGPLAPKKPADRNRVLRRWGSSKF